MIWSRDADVAEGQTGPADRGRGVVDGGRNARAADGRLIGRGHRVGLRVAVTGLSRAPLVALRTGRAGLAALTGVTGVRIRLLLAHTADPSTGTPALYPRSRTRGLAVADGAPVRPGALSVGASTVGGMGMVTFVDETTAGSRGDGWGLEIAEERLALRELIRRRVFQEVAEYHAKRPEVFQGLVRPEDAERTLNGYALRTRAGSTRRSRPSWRSRAFERNGFLVLVGDRQVTGPGRGDRAAARRRGHLPEARPAGGWLMRARLRGHGAGEGLVVTGRGAGHSSPEPGGAGAARHRAGTAPTRTAAGGRGLRRPVPQAGGTLSRSSAPC